MGQKEDPIQVWKYAVELHVALILGQILRSQKSITDDAVTCDGHPIKKVQEREGCECDGLGTVSAKLT